MPSYNVQRRVLINADENKVRSVIENFREWPKWSPWLCMEPDAELVYQGEPGQIGHGYQWRGEITGAGGMEITEISDRGYDMALNFIKPFKSKASIRLELQPGKDEADADGVDVTWHMDGNMPFFLFFMIKTMKAMIGADFERGLNMMKEYAETGEVKSSLKIVGVVDVEPCQYIGLPAQCSMKEIGASMKEIMPAAKKLAEDVKLKISGPPGAVYHDIDLVNRHCYYTGFSAIEPGEAGAEIEKIVGEIQPCRAIKVVHTGSYAHLGNAWSAAMSYQRYNKLKKHKKQDPFERYLCDPDTTDEADRVTEIYVPIKG